MKDLELLRAIPREKRPEVWHELDKKNLVHFIDWDSLRRAYALLDKQMREAINRDVSIDIERSEVVSQVKAEFNGVPILNNFWQHFFPLSIYWQVYLDTKGSLPDYLIRFIKKHPEEFAHTAEVVTLCHFLPEIEDDELSTMRTKLLWQAFELMRNMVSKKDEVLGGVHSSVLVT